MNRQFGLVVAIALLVLTGAQCSWFATDSTTQETVLNAPRVNAEDKRRIDAWLAEQGLNQFGDPKETVYAGGSPLFDEKTGETADRYVYIITRHPELMTELGLTYRLPSGVNVKR